MRPRPSGPLWWLPRKLIPPLGSVLKYDLQAREFFMAENDTRVDNLEDEVKILKGEVRRTLVDLRALLMREDSPLNEGSLARRSSPVDRDPNDSSTQSHTAATDTTRQAQGGSADPGFPIQPVREPASAAPSPQQPAYPDQAIGPGVVMPPQMGPQPGAGWPAPQAVQATPETPTPQASSSLESAMAERERRMAEQERRISDQERKIADADSSQRRQDQDFS